MRNFVSLTIVLILAGLAIAGGEKDIAITIYNNNLGLVKDVRGITLTKDLNVLDFDDVASQIDATSVNFRCIDDKNVAVLEQNFLYDLVSTEALLKRYLGLNIEVITENEGRYRGKLLSYDGRYIMLQADDGQVIMVSVEKVIDYKFPSLPDGLILKPTLRWQIDSPSSGNKKCEVSYLTGGIGWQADYVAVVNDADTQLDLSGWVTITNNTGATYEDARMKLVAGDIHKVAAPQYVDMEMMTTATLAKGRAPQFEEESFFEYHLYTLNRPATLNDKEIKQLTLFPTAKTKAKKVYTFDSQSNRYSGNSDNLKIKVNLEFDNAQKAGLGIPLPKGKVRVYKEDSEKALQFVGEDMIDHTPKDEKVRVYLGDAFDITGERKMVNMEDLGKSRRRETYEITLKNHKDTDITVTVVEHPQGWREWEIKNSNYESRKVDNYKIEFDLPVKQNGETTLTYVIQYN